MTAEDLRNDLVLLARSLFDRGFSVGSAGNISVRLPEGGFLMTPTNASLGRLVPGELSVLDTEGRHISGPKPSKEVVMHLAVYEARPAAGAVVHLHSTYATAMSCLAGTAPAGEGPSHADTIPALTPYFVMRVGRSVPFVPYFRPGTEAGVADVRAAASVSAGILLGNHGSIVAGSTLHDAVNAAEEFEASAQLAFLLEGRATRALTPDEISELEHMKVGR